MVDLADLPPVEFAPARRLSMFARPCQVSTPHPASQYAPSRSTSGLGASLRSRCSRSLPSAMPIWLLSSLDWLEERHQDG